MELAGIEILYGQRTDRDVGLYVCFPVTRVPAYAPIYRGPLSLASVLQTSLLRDNGCVVGLTATLFDCYD